MKRFVYILTTLLLACSCSEDNGLEHKEAEAVVAVSILEDGSRLPVYEGASIGVFTMKGTEMVNENVRHVIGKDGVMTDVETAAPYSPEDGEKIYAYMPYQDGWNSAMDGLCEFTVSADQTSADLYAASDLLVSDAAVSGDSGAEVVLEHMFSKIVISVVDKTGENSLESSSVSLTDVCPAAYIYMSERTLTVDPVRKCDIRMFSEESTPIRTTAYAVIPPQVLESGQPFIELHVPGRMSVYRTEMQIELEPGKVYDYVLRLTEYDLELEGAAITDWESGRDDVPLDNVIVD